MSADGAVPGSGEHVEVAPDEKEEVVAPGSPDSNERVNPTVSIGNRDPAALAPTAIAPLVAPDPIEDNVRELYVVDVVRGVVYHVDTSPVEA